MPGHRVTSVEQNIHFVDGANDEIGGAYQHGALTWSEMAEWMEIVFQKPVDEYAPFPCLEPGNPVQPVAQHGLAIIMTGNMNVIAPGYYVILSPEVAIVDIPINRQNPMPRTASRSSLDSSTIAFRDRIRARDGRCVVSGLPPTGCDNFIILEAAHIFPLANLDIWKAQSWQTQITDDSYVGETGINSIQNGILLEVTAHRLFDYYYLAINPDRNYKTYCFVHYSDFDNQIMFRNPNTADQYQPCRELLKNHFRMCVA